MIAGSCRKNEKSNDSINFDLTRESPSSNNHSASNSAIFDPFFGIRILSPRFTLEIFNTYCNELKKTKLSSLNSTSSIDNSMLMGVIVETTGIRRSANGKDYMIWHISDLISDNKVKLLLFSDAAQSHWKLQPGFVVAITNADMAEDNKSASTSVGNKLLTLKLTRDLQVLSLGLCPDYGTCTGLKKNGERCTNYVNASISPVCVYHLQTEAKKLRFNRGSLSAISNERPKCFMAKSPPKPTGLFTVKRSNSFQSKKSVNLFTGSASPLIASKSIGNNVRSTLTQGKENKLLTPSPKLTVQTPTTLKSESMFSSNNVLRSFIDKKTFAEQSSSQSPSVAPTIKNVQTSCSLPQRSGITAVHASRVQPKPQFTLAEQAARKRAAEVFKKSQQSDNVNSHKRKASSNDSLEIRPVGFSSSKITNDQIRRLLEKKSVHEHEIEKADRDLEQRYFKTKEVEEKIETHATTLMEIKDVNVVTCKTCKYTNIHLAQRCVELQHEYTRHKATKRFFKCKDCSTRTFCFGLMPTHPCTQCSCRKYVRVAMRDERKIREREKLQIRGEERKYVNI